MPVDGQLHFDARIDDKTSKAISLVRLIRVEGNNCFKKSYTYPNSTAHERVTKVSSDDLKVMI